MSRWGGEPPPRRRYNGTGCYLSALLLVAVGAALLLATLGPGWWRW